MDFLKFGSLRLINSEESRIIQEIKESELCKGEWIVTEKIHGANAGIYVNANGIKVASRSGFLEEFNKFHGFQQYVEGYKKGLESFHKQVLNGLEDWFKVSDKELDELEAYTVIYGEYFGGSIQKGMPYPNEKEFRAFQVFAVINKTRAVELMLDSSMVYFEDPALEGKIILGSVMKTETLELLNNITGLSIVEPIFRGSFDGALTVNKERATDYWCGDRIAGSGIASKGEEALKHYMTSEGLVIEPNTTTVVNGSVLVLKRKSEKFKEKEKVDKSGIPLSERNKLALDEQEFDFLCELDSMVTQHRFETAVSKIGEVDIKSFPTILKEIMKDIQKDGEEFLTEVSHDDPERFNGRKLLKEFEHSQEIMMLLTNTVKSFIRPLLLDM